MKTLKIFLILFLLLVLASCSQTKPQTLPTPSPSSEATFVPGLMTQVGSNATALPSSLPWCDDSILNCIHDLVVDKNGNLWATSQFGVVYWDLLTEKYVYWELLKPSDQGDRDTMVSIVIAGDGTVIASSYQGEIFAFRHEGWVHEVSNGDPLLVQADGSVWASNYSGRTYKYINSQWTYQDQFFKPEGAGICCITSDSYGNVWGIRIGGSKSPSYLMKYDKEQWNQFGDYSLGHHLVPTTDVIWFENFTDDKDQVCQIGVNEKIDCFIYPDESMWYVAVLFGQNNEAWIRSSNNEFLWHLNNGQWNKLEGLTMEGDRMQAVYVTADGVIFIGTAGQGIIRYDDKGIKRYFVNDFSK